MKFDTLYGADKNGGYKEWSVETEGNTITVTHGKLGGKLQSKVTVCKGKNVGRSNETSDEQQAELEAQSKWNKQIDKYYRKTIIEVDKLATEGVMLAQDYTKKPHFLEDEFYLSPKLDGLRVKTTFVDGEPVWSSRGGKVYPVPKHLIETLKSLHVQGIDSLDGEAYIHGVKLQNIQSCVKKTNKLTPQVTYQVFDIPSDKVWTERLKDLYMLDILLWGTKHIDIVIQELCTKGELAGKLQGYLESGYEGVMLRNPKGLYAFQNKRSNDLLKYKLFKDSEAKVIGCSVDKNDEGVLLCEWNGVTVELKMKGDHEYRCYDNQVKLIGSWVNFTYQDLTEDGVPTFAVGQSERLCDSKGQPLE